MQKRTKEGLPRNATPDMHRLCDVRSQPTPDKDIEIPPVAPSQPHEWKELRMEEDTFGGEAI